MPLRFADLSATRRFEVDGAYMVLRVGLSKGEADRVRDMQAALKIDPAVFGDPSSAGTAALVEIDQRTAGANRVLFEILCVEWSLPDPPTAEAYAKLDQESGNWVDECIEEVLRDRRERAEKKSGSSKRRSARGSSAPD